MNLKLFRIVLAVVVVATLVVTGGAWLNDPGLQRFGQVMVQAGGHDYVATLPKAILLLVIALLLLWLLWSLLAAPVRAFVRYRRKQARTRLIDGLSALHHGRWQSGEKLLLSVADDAESGPVALSAALRAADKRGDEAAAATYLRRLEHIDPLRHALLQARRLLGRDQAAEALALLDTPGLQPLPPRGHVLRQRALIALGRAEESYGMLGALRSQQALPSETLSALENTLAISLLQQSADTTVLAGHWESLPRDLHSDPQVVYAYAERAIALGWNSPAQRAVIHALNLRWSPELLPLLVTSIDEENAEYLAPHLQRWQEQHPRDPALLLTLGRLQLRQGAWQQAQELLHQALAEGADASAWEALSDVHAAAGDPATALICLRNVLRVTAGQAPLPVIMPAVSEDTASTGIHSAYGQPLAADIPPAM